MRRGSSTSRARSSRMISAPLPLQPQMTTWPLALVEPMPFPFVHDGGDELRGDGAAHEGDEADAGDLHQVEDEVATGVLMS